MKSRAIIFVVASVLVMFACTTTSFAQSNDANNPQKTEKQQSEKKINKKELQTVHNTEQSDMTKKTKNMETAKPVSTTKNLQNKMSKDKTNLKIKEKSTEHSEMKYQKRLMDKNQREKKEDKGKEKK